MTKELSLLPFNLEEALKNPDRVVYRNGEKPLEWHWMGKANQEDYCITSVLSDGSFETHLINGRTLLGWNTDSSDLFLLPLPERRYWVNVYARNEFVSIGDAVYPSEEEAKKNASIIRPYIKSISFTI